MFPIFKLSSTIVIRSNSLIYINNNECIEIKGDNITIGGFNYQSPPLFTKHVINLIPNTTYYLFTDGYLDQFGGYNNKKLGVQKFKDLLTNISEFDVSEQEVILNDVFNDWKGDNSQIDDTMVVGFRI